MPSILILYFAAARTALDPELDSQTVQLPTTPFSLSLLRAHLASLHPGNDQLVSVLARSLWSVNEEMVDADDEPSTMLHGDETVCPIPPVSGG